MNDKWDGAHWFKADRQRRPRLRRGGVPGGEVGVRDTKDRSKAPHVYTRHEWECFLAGAKRGEFDLPQCPISLDKRRPGYHRASLRTVLTDIIHRQCNPCRAAAAPLANVRSVLAPRYPRTEHLWPPLRPLRLHVTEHPGRRVPLRSRPAAPQGRPARRGGVPDSTNCYGGYDARCPAHDHPAPLAGRLGRPQPALPQVLHRMR